MSRHHNLKNIIKEAGDAAYEYGNEYDEYGQYGEYGEEGYYEE
jgi:hypothetical protein